MRLLADENIPLHSVRALRSAGHDVYSATEDSPGAPDLALIEHAIRDERLIITFDRDFGDAVARGNQKPTAGVLFLRIIPKGAAEITRLLLELFNRTDITWAGHLTVVDAKHLRQRRL